MLLSHFLDEEAEAQPVCTTLKALLQEEGARPESRGSCLRSPAHICGLQRSPDVHSSLPCKPDGPVETHGVGRCSLTSGPGAKLCSPAWGPRPWASGSGSCREGWAFSFLSVLPAFPHLS